MSRANCELDLFAMKDQKVPSTGRRAALVPRPRTPLPLFSPASSKYTCLNPGTAPLTIFYGGAVSVFNLSHDKAEAVMKLAAAEGGVDQAERREAVLLEGDLPLARKMSLQRFLEKRRERLTASGPYGGREGDMVGAVKKTMGATTISYF